MCYDCACGCGCGCVITRVRYGDVSKGLILIENVERVCYKGVLRHPRY